MGTSLIAALVLIAGVVGPGAAATAAGDPPEVFDTSAFGTTERPISVFLSGFDPDGEAITYGIESAPSNGALTDDCSDGICTYTSDVGFVGTDTFTYSASDGDLTSTSATVTVTVQDDLPPDVFPGSFVTKVDQQVSIFLSGFDPNGDPVTFSVDTPPPNGSLDDCSTGSCTYTPDAGFIGIDTFTFTGSDGLNVSTPASVTIDVQEDVAPVASDGSSTTSVDTPVFLFLSAFDDNGDSLTYTVETGPTDGILADCSSGFCTYTPDAGFVGTDSLTFSRDRRHVHVEHGHAHHRRVAAVRSGDLHRQWDGAAGSQPGGRAEHHQRGRFSCRSRRRRTALHPDRERGDIPRMPL